MLAYQGWAHTDTTAVALRYVRGKQQPRRYKTRLGLNKRQLCSRLHIGTNIWHNRESYTNLIKLWIKQVLAACWSPPSSVTVNSHTGVLHIHGLVYMRDQERNKFLPCEYFQTFFQMKFYFNPIYLHLNFYFRILFNLKCFQKNNKNVPFSLQMACLWLFLTDRKKFPLLNSFFIVCGKQNRKKSLSSSFWSLLPPFVTGNI